MRYMLKASSQMRKKHTDLKTCPHFLMKCTIRAELE